MTATTPNPTSNPSRQYRDTPVDVKLVLSSLWIAMLSALSEDAHSAPRLGKISRRLCSSSRRVSRRKLGAPTSGPAHLLVHSLSVPVEQLRRGRDAPPKSREVVAYCRGRYCVYAVEAVALLRKRGYRARRLVDGFPGWRGEGRKVAVGA